MEHVPVRNYRWPVLVERDPNCLMHLAMDPQGTSRNLVDLTGNNNDGELKDGAFPVIIEGPSHKCIKFDGGLSGSSRIVVANPSFNDELLLTFTFWARLLSLGELSNGYFFYTGNGGIYMFASATENASIWITMSPTVGKYSLQTYAFPYSDWAFFGMAINRTAATPIPNPTFVINGLEVEPTNVTQGSGTPTLEGSADTIIGNTPSTNRAIDATFDDFRVFNRLLSVEEMRERYLYGARKPITYHHRTSWPVDASSKTTGYAGPWSIRAGTAQYEDDGDYRGVTSKANGTRVVIPSNLVYGSWYFRLKPIQGTINFIFFISDADRDIGGSGVGLTGYMLVVDLSTLDRIGIVRVIDGSQSNVVYSDSYVIDEADYEIFISRDAINRAATGPSRFQVWIRGNDYDTWTLLITGYSFSGSIRESHFFNVERLQNNTELKDLKTFLMPFDPNEHPELRDPIAT